MNKEEVRPSANAKTSEFLREVVAPNVLALWKSKEVMGRETGAIDHGNRHALVETYHDVEFVVDLLVEEDIFMGCFALASYSDYKADLEPDTDSDISYTISKIPQTGSK